MDEASEGLISKRGLGVRLRFFLGCMRTAALVGWRACADGSSSQPSFELSSRRKHV